MFAGLGLVTEGLCIVDGEEHTALIFEETEERSVEEALLDLIEQAQVLLRDWQAFKALTEEDE